MQTAEFDNTGFLRLSHLRVEMLSALWFVLGLLGGVVTVGVPPKSLHCGAEPPVRLQTLFDFLNKTKNHLES